MTLTELTYPELESAVDRAIAAYLLAMNERDGSAARVAASTAAGQCRCTVEGAQGTITNDQRASALVLGVFCAACRDFADCYQLSSKRTLSHDEIETSWIRLIDCLDRLARVEGAMTGPAADWLTQHAERSYDSFEKRFGSGMFLSPEIILDRELCSICNDDYRGCSHRSGQFYNGILCRRRPKFGDIRAVAIVRHPADRRCRLWPWRYDESNRTVKGIILTAFDPYDLRDPEDRSSSEQPKLG